MSDLFENLACELNKNNVSIEIHRVVSPNLLAIGEKIILDFSKHDKVFEDKISELKAKIAIKDMDYKTASELLGKYQRENESLKKRIQELDTIDAMRIDENRELKQRIAELESNEMETCEKEPISDDCRPSMEWYENRHQSDCIEINRLNMTIDVLIHKVEYLRQFAGLE